MNKKTGKLVARKEQLLEILDDGAERSVMAAAEQAGIESSHARYLLEDLYNEGHLKRRRSEAMGCIVYRSAMVDSIGERIKRKLWTRKELWGDRP